MGDVQSVMKDPDFLGLPATEKVKVLSHMDADFAGLPAGEQMKVIGIGAQKQPTNFSAMRPQDLASQAMAASGVTGTQRLAPTAPRVNMQQSPNMAIPSAAIGAYNTLLSPSGDVGRFHSAVEQGLQGVASGVGDMIVNGGATPEGMAHHMIKAIAQSKHPLASAAGVNGEAIEKSANPSGTNTMVGTQPPLDRSFPQPDYASLAGHSALPLALAMAGGRKATALSDEIAASRASSPAAMNKYVNNLSGAIGESSKAINVPAEVKNVIGDVRQTAANEGMTATDFSGKNAAGGMRKAIGKTLENHESNYQQLFDSVRNNPVPDAVKARIKNAIGQEVSSAMESIMPEDAASIKALKNRSENLNTWEDINDARQLMNRASQAAWKKPEAMQLNSPNHTQALQTGSNVIREELYNEIGRANGLSPDAVRALKQKEGSLLKLDAMAEGIENKTSNSQASYDSMTKFEKIRQGKTPAEALKEAIPFVGKMSPQELVATKAARAFKNLPAANGGIGIAPNVANMPQRLPQLPAQTGGAYPQYAADPGMSAGEFRASVGQQVRQRQPLQLPATASATKLPTRGTPLPDITAIAPGERVAAIMQWVRENQARLTNQKALPANVEPIRLPPSRR